MSLLECANLHKIPHPAAHWGEKMGNEQVCAPILASFAPAYEKKHYLCPLHSMFFDMRKFHTLCAALLLTVATAGCFGPPSLQEFVNATSHELPIDQGNGVSMTSIDIDGDYLVFTMSQASMDRQHLLHGADADTREMYRQCAREGKGLKVVTADSTLLELSPEQMRAEFPGTE